MSGSTAKPLAGCRVVSLRPVGGHAGLRRAAAAHGARLLAVSPWRLRDRDDPDTRAALDNALGADTIVVTSPAAVRAAARLRPLGPVTGARWLAVGSGTAAALRRAGVAAVDAPARMDSEGLLALPALHAVDGTRVGLLAAPGGRDRIAPTLRQRGATVLRADVYERVPVKPGPRALAALRALPEPAWLALSSGGALATLLAQLPADAAVRLRRARVVAASERLATVAREAGFDRIVVARSARPRDLLAAAAAGIG